MGLFWDLIQQNQISDQRSSLTSVDERVKRLEEELLATRTLLREVIGRLEKNLRVDLDADGRLG